jgi:2-methylcitrate dehydratase PrpD
VAKVLGLDAEASGRALGIAGSHAASLQTGKGTPVKPFHAGRAAEAGVHFAEMARSGLPAPLGVFEGDRGFIEVVNDGKCKLAALAELGRTYALEDPGVALKLYPVCSAAQAAAEETARILAEEGIAGDDVERVLCEVTPLVAISLDHDRPRTPSEAQFSMPFAVGCMLAFGDLGLARLNPDTLADPGLSAAMAKVSMRTSPELADDPETPVKCPEGAFVTLRTKGGREIRRFNPVATGMPANPMSDEDLEGKFRDCAAFAGEDRGRADALIRRIGTVESLPRASDLFGP